MHIYQKNILDQLRQTPVMRYSQMQPDDVESSHFKYHLNQLIKDKLVEQKGRGLYGLTQTGQKAVDKLSSGRVNPHQTPKVITYTLLTDADNYFCAPTMRCVDDQCQRRTCATDDDCPVGFCVESACYEGYGTCEPLPQ